MKEQENLDIVRKYLAALESGLAGDALAPFFSEVVLQVEFPNRLNPNGQESDFGSVLERSIQGKKILTSQKYDILNELAQGDRVAVEANWTGTLAVPLGELTEGFEMKAHFAMFFELRKGRIVRQHNYDCFEPW